MKRQPGWRAALAAEVERHRRMELVPGQHDCALFAADCVKAMTGEDPAAPFRGRYKTFRGGAMVLRRSGETDLMTFLSRRFQPIMPARAAIGDIALVPSPDPDAGVALGVVTGAAITVLAPVGLGVVPLATAIAAWRV